MGMVSTATLVVISAMYSIKKLFHYVLHTDKWFYSSNKAHERKQKVGEVCLGFFQWGVIELKQF